MIVDLSVFFYEILCKSGKFVLPFGWCSCVAGISSISAVSVGLITAVVLDSVFVPGIGVSVNKKNIYIGIDVL